MTTFHMEEPQPVEGTRLRVSAVPAPRLTRRSALASCRSCGRVGLEGVLDLGDVPLSDAFAPPAQAAVADVTYPLEVAMCPTCALVQLLEIVPPEVLFCRDYPYYSSVSASWVEHCRRSALALIRGLGLDSDSLVLEPASNDGYMLGVFASRGIPVLGVEPARGPAEVAVQRGIPTRVEFFTLAFAERLREEGVQADLLLANNVLAHVSDLNGFVAGVAHVLAPDGWAVLEVPHLVRLVEGRAFDTIYHEHLYYFSVTALDPLFARHGLHLSRVERLATHGGSLRLHVSRRAGPRPSVEALLAEEAILGVGDPEYVRALAEGVRAVGAELRRLIAALRSQGESVAAYGAPAKGTILLNVFGLGPDQVEYAVDKNPRKRGCLIPGVGIPVHSVARLRSAPPDVLLLLPWNLEEEILTQEAEFRRRGGRFLIPLPWPRLV